MKITVTYKTSQQISPDDFASYTKVIHTSPEATLKDLYTQITKGWSTDQDVNVELHYIEVKDV